MIHNWRLSRFKSIGQLAEIHLAPLTVLCGANSSGKSTLIHSMLLVSQSVASRSAGAPLQLNGARVQLGTFADVLHRNSGAGFSISMDFDARWEDVRAEVGPGGRVARRPAVKPSDKVKATLDVTVSANRQRGDAGTSVVVTRLYLKEVAPDSVSFELLVRKRGGPSPVLHFESHTTPTQVLGNNEYVIQLTDTGSDGREEWQPRRAYSDRTRPEGVEIQGIVPTSVYYSYDRELRQLEQGLIELLLLGAPASYAKGVIAGFNPAITELLRGFLAQPEVTKLLGSQVDPVDLPKVITRGIKPATARKILAEVGPFFDKQKSRASRTVRFERQRLPNWVSSANQSLLTELAGMRHVGPLREVPRALYELSTAADPQDVGARGQFAAAVLNRYGGTRVRHYVDGAVQEDSLQSAVDYWLTTLGVSAGARTQERGKLGYQLAIRDEALVGDLDLTQVGVGVSQLLPILVQALLTPPGGILLLEQPELHLHPAIQSRLANFLVAMIKSERQVVCETHSEYLVNRLRIMTAEQTLSTSDELRIYFVRRRGGTSSFDEVAIDRRGRIARWPEGFFDQSALDAARLLELDLAAE